METKAIEYKTINRAISNQEVSAGWLEELINLRHKNGKLQPVTKYADSGLVIEKGAYLRAWHHDQDGIDNFIGQKANNEIHWINIVTGHGTLIKSCSGIASVTFLKKFMVVSDNSNMDVFLFQNDAYRLISMPSRPIFQLKTTETHRVETEETTGSAEAILGMYYKKLNEQSAENLHTGSILVRAALKMFDGSYVLHTIPQQIRLGLSMSMHEKQAGSGSNQWDDPNKIMFWVSKLKVILSGMDFFGIDSKIFTSVCFFACKNEELFDISSETLTDSVVLEKVKEKQTGDFWVDFDDILTGKVSEKYKEMSDSPSWYLVHETDIETIQEDVNISLKEEEFDMKGFYQDYATRETLTVDNFSHHKLYGKNTYNYNSRLIIGDISYVFSDYALFPLLENIYYYDVNIGNILLNGNFFPVGHTVVARKECKIVVTLATDSGDIKKVYGLGFRPFAAKDGKEYMVLSAGGVVGYPDARAKKIVILAKKSGSWYNISEIKLKKSKYGNYAYFVNDNFSTKYADIASGALLTFSNQWNANYSPIMVSANYSSVVNINDFVSDIFSDNNRIQVSELNNPFVFPAKNSYQIGTGTVLACAANTEPLSTGQFGEYPLNIFTSKGVWSLMQGSGDVLFSNISPLNGEVALNTENIVSIGFGVIYTTERGVFLITGRTVNELTQSLYGAPNIALKEYQNFLLRLNHTQLVQLSASLCKVDARTYMNGAKVAYDKKNNEIILTNSGFSPNNEKYSYSFVYSFESNGWHKTNDSYELLIYSYPNLFAVSANASDSTVYEIGLSGSLQSVNCCAITRPLKIDDRIDFVLLHRVLQRCELETSSGVFAGFYIFGSNDLVNWQILVGSDKKDGVVVDMLTTRAHTKSKYFVFVFASSMSDGDSVGRIEYQYYTKLGNKLR